MSADEGGEKYTGVDVQNAVVLARIYQRDKGQFKKALEETIEYTKSGIPAIEESAKRSLNILIKEGIITGEDIKDT